MAENFQGINQETLKNVELLKNSMKEISDSTKNINKQLEQQVNITSNYASIVSSASKFAELQTKVSKSASTTTKAFGEQQKQLSNIKSLNAQIENLMDQMVTASKEEEKLLLRQANNLAAARDNAKELANAYGELAENSASLDKSTMWFSAVAEVAKDIPGLRKLSGPFEAASQAARETVISNAKIQNINSKISSLGKEALTTGKGLTKEKLKELGLNEQIGNLTGKSAANALKTYQASNKTASAGIAGLQAGFKSLGPIITKALGPLAILGGIIKIAQFFVKSMFEASVQTAEFQRDMGLTADEANNLRSRTFEIAKNSSLLADTQGRILITQKQISQSQKEINNALDTQIDLTQELGVFGQKLLVQSSILRDNFGLGAEAVEEIDKEAIRTGKSVEDITKNTFGTIAAIGLEKGILLDVNKILSEATRIQGNLRLSFKGSTAEIANAVAQSKLLGLTLQQNASIAENLLDFEQSISSELEAELLTGRELNLERARLAALNGDFLQVGKEINAQGITYNNLQKMNLIQRKAIANSLGLSVDELADATKKQEEYNALQARALINGVKIADIEKQSLKEIYEENKKIGRTEEQIKAALGEEIFARKQAEDAQTKFNKALDSAKESFAKLAESKTIDKFADILTKFISTVQSKGIISALFADYKSDEEKLQDKVNNELRFSGRVSSRTQDEIKSKNLELKDNKIREISTKDYIIKTLPEDTVVGAGGTKLGRTDEMVDLLKELIVAVKSGGNIYLDGTKVGTAMAVSTYRVQ